MTVAPSREATLSHCDNGAVNAPTHRDAGSIFSRTANSTRSPDEIAPRPMSACRPIYKYYGSKEALLFNSWIPFGPLTSEMIAHLQGIEPTMTGAQGVLAGAGFFDKNPIRAVIMSSVYLTPGSGPPFQHPALSACS